MYIFPLGVLTFLLGMLWLEKWVDKAVAKEILKPMSLGQAVYVAFCNRHSRHREDNKAMKIMADELLKRGVIPEKP
jgi:hypothetical protein